MRVFSIVTALLLAAFLYLVVMDRETLLAVAGTSAAEGVGTTTEAEAEAAPRVSVVALRSEARLIDSAVLLRGQTEAARQVSVMSETSGRIVSDPLRKGAWVEEGALLCELDPGTRGSSLAEAEARVPEAEARLAEARARVTEATINDTAAERLSEGGFASETRVASARAGLEAAEAAVKSATAGVQSAEAAVAAAEKEIERLEIRAPFAGLLESDTAELGTLMQPGVACATVIQLDPIKLVGFVPETEVDRIEVGAEAGARLATRQQVAGVVSFLSRSADQLTRTFRVEIEVPNPDLSIRDGQTAEILISASGDQAHLLPASAMTLDNSGNLGVRIVDEDDQARFVPVGFLRDTVDGVWLTGLPEQVSVIVVGQEYVNDGVLLEVTYKEADQ